MRESVALFADQYRFFKELKSEKLLVAFVEYLFEGIEPEGLNSLEQTVFDSLRVRMDNQSKRSEAGKRGGANSHGGGRPKGTNKKQTENKQKTSKKQTKNKQVEVEVEEEVKVEDKVKEITLSNDNVETEVSSFGNKEINELITNLKGYANSLGIAYDNTKERYFSKFILTAKEYGDFCEKIGQSRTEFAINIMKASIHINYWKGICGGPMKIYQNYSDVYNETLKFKNKVSKNLIQSF